MRPLTDALEFVRIRLRIEGNFEKPVVDDYGLLRRESMKKSSGDVIVNTGTLNLNGKLIGAPFRPVDITP